MTNNAIVDGVILKGLLISELFGRLNAAQFHL